MRATLLAIGCVWLVAADAFALASCRVARRPIPHPEADGMPNQHTAGASESLAQDDIGAYANAPRTVVVSSTAKPGREKPVLREAPNGAS